MFHITIADNLQLKLLTHADATVFYDLICKNREHLERFVPRIGENTDVAATKRVIDLFLRQLLERNGFRAGIVFGDTLVGVAGLKYIDWLNRKTEVMYWVDCDYQNRGIATACVRQLLSVSFKHYDLEKVQLRANEHNTASIRVAEKCGFVFEGTARRDELLGSGYADVHTFSLIRSEYERCSS